MLNPCRNKDDAACADLLIFISNLHARTAADHVIHLVFFVRRLRVCAPCGQNVKTRAQGWNAKEFQITFSGSRSLLLEICKLKKITAFASHILSVVPRVFCRGHTSAVPPATRIRIPDHFVYTTAKAVSIWPSRLSNSV